jgi:hypothetical protein
MSDSFTTKYGPTALITGAANGIGRGFAARLAARNLSLLLVDIDAEGLEAAASALREANDVSVTTCVADLSRLSELDRVNHIAREHEVGLLVNNAGIGHKEHFLGIALEEHLTALDVNIRASLVLTHQILPALQARGRGGLIFTSSMSALVGGPGIANYAATKAYGRHLAEALYGELHRDGIDVLALMPGLTRTRQVTAGYTEAELDAQRPMEPEVVAETALLALGRKRFVIPGLLNRLQAWAFVRLPRGPLLRAMGRKATPSHR